MTKINNKAKVRRLTKLLVLGKAKVMSYKDIKETRAKRIAKDAIKGKGKRSQKRKSNILDADKPEVDKLEALELELELELARAVKEVIKGRGKRG